MTTINAIQTAFTQAAKDTFTMIGGPALAEGPSYQHHHTEIENSIAVYIGILGQLEGYVIIRFVEATAKAVASLLMMGMPVEAIDDMAISALSELGNMMIGGAATNLSVQGVEVDITTPTVLQGTVQIKQAEIMPISIPLEGDSIRIVIDLALKVPAPTAS